MSNPMHQRRLARMCAALAVTGGVALAAVPVSAHAAEVGLGTSDSFAVLAGQSVTNTGPSVITGDVGVSPGSAIVGFPPGIVIDGTFHAADGVATQAQADLTTAYDVAALEPPATIATELGGTTLTAGAYNSASGTFEITGTATFDAQGDPNAQFVIQTASTLVTASGSDVELINGAQACNVFWQVGSSATLGTGSDFQGNILALTSITATTGTDITGRALARNGSVTLDTNTITRPGCVVPVIPPVAPPTSTPPAGTTTPPSGAVPIAEPAAATTRNGTARLRRTPSEARTPSGVCTTGFHARVRGAMIRQVVFTMDGRRIGSRTRGPFTVSVPSASAGRHIVRARVTFRDATRSRTLRMRYRACGAAAATLNPTRGPSRFTG